MSICHVLPMRPAAPDPIEIHLIQGSDEAGEVAWYYLAICGSLVKSLFISLKCRTTDIEKYGVILASGFGEPDEDTKNYIRTLLKKEMHS